MLTSFVAVALGCARTPSASADGTEAVRGYVKRLDARYGDVDVSNDDTPRLPLPGLRLYVALPKVLDGSVLHCFVRDRETWCDDRSDALARVVAAYELGRDPAKLTDAEWIDLVVFARGSVLLRDAPDAKARVPKLPEDRAVLVKPPHVERQRGVVITYAAALVANTSGPYGVMNCRVEVKTDTAIDQTCDPVFKGTP